MRLLPGFSALLCLLAAQTHAQTTDSLLARIQRGDTEGVRTLLEQPGVDVNADDGTPLFWAVRMRNTDIVRLLLDHGARTENVVTHTGATLGHYAAGYGPDAMLELLLEHGAPVDVADHTGATPLHWAAVLGSMERTRMLLEAGVRIDARSKAGLSPRDIAVNWKQEDVADLLRDRGAVTAPPPLLPRHGPYLGETPPGDTPKRFAADLLALPFDNHGPIQFSPDGDELIGSQNALPVRCIWSMEETREGWSAPAVLQTSDAWIDGFPALSPTGDVLYIYSTRPPGGEHLGAIWRMKRIESGWSETERLSLPAQKGQSLIPGTLDDEGWLYGYTFGDNIAGGYGEADIFRVNLNDPDPQIELLEPPINGEYADVGPAIAPDGSYLVFTSTRPTEGIDRAGLYVTFRQDNGGWSDAIPLDPSINQNRAWQAFITRDGKYLFFQRGWNEYYWVSASVIERMRPE